MVKKHAHVGYVYALAVAALDGQPVLISGSGDEEIKVRPSSWLVGEPMFTFAQLWTCSTDGIQLRSTLLGESDAVLTIVAHESTVYAGHQGGHVKVSRSPRSEA